MVDLNRFITTAVVRVLVVCVSPGNARKFRHVFLRRGQSNMAGRGGVDGRTWDKFVPKECKSTPSSLSLTGDLDWVEAVEPIGREMDSPKVCVIGPGIPFAHAFLQQAALLPFNVEVGLVSSAVGGTSISKWSRGSDLYDQLVKRTHAAMLDGRLIRALLWYQGETDTRSIDTAEAYQDNLAKFFTDFRTDMILPLLPIIQVVLVSGENPANIEVVRNAQLAVFSELPNVRCVDARNLNVCFIDKLH